MVQPGDSRENWVIGSATDAGRTGKNNEDAWACFEAEWQAEELKRVRVAVVADGIGGHNAGEVASRIAVEKIETLMRALRSVPLAERIARAIQHANQEIYNTSQNNASLLGMGSTVLLAAAAGDQLTVAHAGDSRAYLLRDGKLHRLTLDHTWAQEAIDIGRLTPDQARVHPNRNVIKRYLGVDEGLVVDQQIIDIDRAPQQTDLAGGWPLVETMTLRSGDTVLLCSDGLNDELTDAEIEATLASHEPQAAAEQLVAEANAHGGRDNITTVVMRWGAGASVARAAAPPATLPRAAATTPVTPARSSSGFPLWLAALLAFVVLAASGWLLLRRTTQPAASTPPTPLASTQMVQPPTLEPSPVVTTPAAPATAAVVAAAVTATATPEPRAISTVLPTFTPTSTPVPPTPTFTPRPTATTGAVIQPTLLPGTGGPVSGVLVQPTDGDTRNGEVTFRWAITAGALPAGMGYEVFFYQRGQDPLRDGFGLAAPTTQESQRINLTAVDDDPGSPLAPGVYLWGVRVAPLNGGGAARQVVAAGRQLTYQRSGGGQPPPPTVPTATPTTVPTTPPPTAIPTNTAVPTPTPVP